MRLLFALLLFCVITTPLRADTQLRLSTSEWEPYISIVAISA